MPRDDAPVPAAIEPLPADAAGPPELVDAATLYRRIERTFFGTLTRKLVAFEMTDRAIARHGYRVMRFWNHDVLGNLDGVMEAIRRELESPPHPGPHP